MYNSVLEKIIFLALLILFYCPSAFSENLYPKALATEEQLELPTSTLADKLSLRICNADDTNAAISGLNLFQKRFNPLDKQTFPSSQACLPKLKINTNKTLAAEISDLDLKEIAIGSESLFCSGNKAYLSAALNSSKLYPLSESLINFYEQLNSNRSVVELKRQLAKLKKIKITSSAQALNIRKQINELNFTINYVQYFSKDSLVLASYFDSLCSEHSVSTRSLAISEPVDSGNDYVAPGSPIKILGSAEALNGASSTTTAPSANYAYGPVYTVTWTNYWDGKLDFVETYRYNAGPVNFYFFKDLFPQAENNSFFQGWFGAPCTDAVGSNKTSSCNFYLNQNINIVTRWQRCAEPLPNSASFSSINDMERKLVQFAKNIPDKNLKISPKGEVNAIAVEYSDGRVCTKFIAMPLGGGSIESETIPSFFESYKGKSIKRMFYSHSHDSNSNKELAKDKEKKKSMFYKNGNYYYPVPSSTDIFANGARNLLKFNKILALGKVIERVISADGTAFEYFQPVTFKLIGMFKNTDKLLQFDERLQEVVIQAVEKSRNADNRTGYNNKDAQAGQQARLNLYKKELGTTIIPYTVQ